jgi:hypothetical protein
MRICVFSHQRSGSSLMCNWLSEKYGIENISEWFDHKIFNEELYEKLYNDNYVVKIMASDFLKEINFDKIPWHLFDEIIITEREDKTIAMASAYIVYNEFDLNIPVPFNFDLPNDFFITWSKILKEFFVRKKHILKNYKNVKHYYLSDILKLLAEDNYSKIRENKKDYYERCNNLKFFKPRIIKLCKSLTSY